MKTLVGTYTSLATAHKVVDELITAGFSASDVGIVAHDPKGEYATYIDEDGVMRQTPANDLRDGRTHDAAPGEDAAAGAGIGATIGGIGGLLLGLGALAIPGVGPIIAAGPLLAALTGAGIGAVTGGLIGAMADMGIPDEDANLYAEGVRRGHVLVTAQVPDTSVDKATQIMTRHDMLDIHREADTWRQGGWNDSDFKPVTNPATEPVQHNRTRL